MAKKTVAGLSKGGSKSLAKAIKMVRSEKTGAYQFKQEILPKDQVKNFLSKKLKPRKGLF